MVFYNRNLHKFEAMFATTRIMIFTFLYKIKLLLLQLFMI